MIDKKDRETVVTNELNEREDEILNEDNLIRIDEIEMEDRKKRIKFIKDSCEQIIDVKKKNDDIVLEYRVVLEYIGDIQKIEQNDEFEKKRLATTAKKIQSIVKEKEKMRSKKIKRLKTKQYAMIEKYEDVMVDEIKKLQNYEKEYNIIRHDLGRLEGERNCIQKERSRTISKQNAMRGFIKTIAITLGILFVIFAIMASVFEKNVTVALAITTVLAAGSVAYVFISSRENVYKAHVNELKMKKLVKLINKMKIKYVNSKNVVDYLNNKYNVRNSKELEYLWERYIKEKERNRQYLENVEILSLYMDSFKRDLERINLNDINFWRNQVSVVANRGEMKEFKENLNERCKNITERLEKNNKVLDLEKMNLRKISEKNDEYKEEVDYIIKKYGIII